MFKQRILLLTTLLVAAAIACNMPALGGAAPDQNTTEPPTDSAPAAEEESATPELEEPTAEEPSPQPEETGEPEEEQPSPTPASAEPPSHGESIYESDLRAGWPDINTDNGSSGHVPGGYQIRIPDGETWAFWVFTTRVYEVEFYAEIEASPNDCPTRQGAYGMVFQHRDDANLRTLALTCNGDYVLRERNSGNEITLAEGPLPEEVDPSTGSHRIGIKAVNNTITAYADDFPLISMNIPGMEGGDIGPYVQTGGAATSVTFTRLAIFEPEEN
jgi:hypothetical protein